jgi:hypothetical protein
MSHEEDNHSSWARSFLGVLGRWSAVIVFVPLLIVLLIPFLLLWLLAVIGFTLLIWTLWCTRGKDILFVYSDSPVWHDYIEQQIIPEIGARSVILNWSDRRHWLHRFSLESVAFRLFGGSREYNPLAIHFRPLRSHLTYRFWKAFRDWKHGKSAPLERMKSDFFRDIGSTA